MTNQRNFYIIYNLYTDLNILTYIKELSNQWSCFIKLKSYNIKNYIDDFSIYYKFNTLCSNINKMDLCLFVSTNPRLEATLINLIINQISKRKIVPIFSFNFFSTVLY